MTDRQRELILWLGRAGYCGPSGILRAGWSLTTVRRCRDEGWIEFDPDRRYSYRPTSAGLRRAAS